MSLRDLVITEAEHKLAALDGKRFKKRFKTEMLFAVANKRRLYSGSWDMRSVAMQEHSRLRGLTWPECLGNGDYIVKIAITWEPRKP